ncbi:MAG TPA: hypothetical protein VHV83_04155 [Armatimonadota bacterium]|nr:hypothetical protein [Armatimonadota bacterium]
MNVAAAMFNTVYDAEGAVRALRRADLQNINIVARDRNKREVFVDDLVTRKRLLFDSAAEEIEVYDRFPPVFLNVLRQSGLPADAVNWFKEWLNDGYVLVAIYLDDGTDEALTILQQHGGVLYGTSRDVMSGYPEEAGMSQATEATEEYVSDEQWQRPAA